MNAETFDNLAGMLGLGDSDKAVPDKLEMINNILNGLPAEQRNILLTEFMNKLFTIA